MSFKRTKRLIAALKSKGMTSKRIADTLNMAGERHPSKRTPFDAYSVDRFIDEINRGSKHG